MQVKSISIRVLQGTDICSAGQPKSSIIRIVSKSIIADIQENCEGACSLVVAKALVAPHVLGSNPCGGEFQVG